MRIGKEYVSLSDMQWKQVEELGKIQSSYLKRSKMKQNQRFVTLP